MKSRVNLLHRGLVLALCLALLLPGTRPAHAQAKLPPASAYDASVATAWFDLLNELVRQTPEGMYLTNIKQDNQTVLVSGVAQTNERVSEFLRNTAYKSEWLERPELQEIKARTEQSKNARDPKRLFEFSIRLSLKRPQDLSAPVKGASAPAGGASRPQPAASAAKS